MSNDEIHVLLSHHSHHKIPSLVALLLSGEVAEWSKAAPC